MPSPSRALLAALLLLGGALPSAVVRAGDAPPALTTPELLTRVGPAVVNLRYVLKWAEGERPYHAIGTVVDPTGLLVVGNDYLGSKETKATDLKVTFAGDPKERAAVVVARDGVLNLAWVQVLGLEAAVAAVDLGGGGDPALGQDLQSVWRAGRGFDHAAAAGRHYVTAAVDKPRRMWSLGGDSPVVGSPVFDAAGRPVGVMATQSGSAGDDEEGGDEAAFLLPLADVRKSLEKAKARVPDAVEKAKAGGDAAPAAGDAPAMDAPPAPGMADAPEQPK